MKVIFIEEIPKVAKVGQKKNVAAGYARNYLLPYGLAVVEGSQAARAAEKELKKKVQARELETAELSAVAEKVEGVEITIAAKVGDNDRLYGSVTAADIAEEVSKVAGCQVDKKLVDLAEPVKQVGSYDVPVKFMWDLIATVKVHVVSDAPVATEEKKSRAAKAEAETPADSEAEAQVEVVVDMPAIDEVVEDLAEEIEAEIEEK